MNDIASIISSCDQVDADADSQFSKILSLHTPELENQLEQISSVKSKLTDLQEHTNNLHKAITSTYQLAEGLSSKIRQLHIAQQRVKSALKIVDGYIDLKRCLEGVEGAIKEENWEGAAQYISSVLSLDDSIDPSTKNSKVLKEAEHKTKSIIVQNFKEMVKQNNVQGIIRFAKLFIPLKMEKEGLELYSDYLISMTEKELKTSVLDKLPSNRETSSGTCVSLFSTVLDIIVSVIETQEGFIVKDLGEASMIFVIDKLLSLCDNVTEKVINTLLMNKLKLIKQKIFNSQQQDTRELDLLLEEMAVMFKHSEAFTRFVNNAVQEYTDKLKAKKQQCPYQIPKETKLQSIMQELLSYYIVIDEYYMKENIKKAIQLNEVNNSKQSESSDTDLSSDEEEDDTPKTSSLVDDSFLVFKQSMDRAISTWNILIVCVIMNHINSILMESFKQELEKQATLKPKQHYDIQFDSDMALLHQKQLIAFNNIEAAAEYTMKLKNQFEKSSEGIFEKDAEQKLKSCSMDLIQASQRFRELLQSNIQKMVNINIKYIIQDALELFINANYDIDEEGYSIYEIRGPFVEKFIQQCDDTFTPYEKTLTKSNFDLIIQEVVLIITKSIEEIVFQKRFTQLGGMQFGKDVLNLLNYFSRKSQKTVRDKFARLIQISDLLKVISLDEVLEYWGDTTVTTWRLIPNEVRKVLYLRKEFSKDTINKLKL